MFSLPKNIFISKYSWYKMGIGGSYPKDKAVGA